MLPADTLLVLLPADGQPVGDHLLDKAIQSAVKQGDFQRKAGVCLYLHGLEGVKAQRVVLVGVKDTSPKSLRAAVANGLASLKGRAVKHLAVVLGGMSWTAAHAEVLVLGLHAAGYTYTHTKPSAEAAAVPAKVSIVCASAEQPLLKKALAHAQAIAAGVDLAKRQPTARAISALQHFWERKPSASVRPLEWP